ncbi:MAG: DNA polymerase III subunit delta [Burkholderiaceae bacterium]|jgi:DNA polymerase-3 subunit delta|nr:DNA polymerase III subunit delta [Burkholderiaceae bacterium]
MPLKADGVAAHLQARRKGGSLAPIYVLAGDEPLLAIEAADAIRAAARAMGYGEREVLHADARFDWSRLAQATSGLSLFSEKRIVELRLPGGKPGKAGGEALREFAASPPPDLLALVSLPRLDRETRASRWATALEQAAVWIDVDRIDRAVLPEWIGGRLARNGQRASRQALEFIADRVEGNLLAAHQEIGKLALLYPAGELGLDQVADAVLNVARYDVYALVPALLAGDGPRALRLLDGLRAEGEPLPLLLWVVAEELRTLLRAQEAVAAGRPFGVVARELRIWGPREKLMPKALRRLSAATLAALLARCADVDRLVKGLAAPGRDSDPWLELGDIALACAAGSQ